MIPYSRDFRDASSPRGSIEGFGEKDGKIRVNYQSKVLLGCFGDEIAGQALKNSVITVDKLTWKCPSRVSRVALRDSLALTIPN
jgi:hypothetical protein